MSELRCAVRCAVLLACFTAATSAQTIVRAPAPSGPAVIDTGTPLPVIRPPGGVRRREVPVFWLVGQSNCAGGANGFWLANPFAPGNRWPRLAYQPFVKIWWPGPSAQRPTSRPSWEDYRTGSFAPINNANWHLTEANFGPEASFGDAASSALGEPVWLFKFVSVAALNPDHHPTFSKVAGRETLFDEIVREWRRAAAALEAQDLVPQIRGVCWIQGEYDFIASYSTSYATHLTRFIGDVRTAIARINPDNVPVRFMIAEMHDRHVPSATYDIPEAHVRAAQVFVSATVEDVFLTDVDDLPLDPLSPSLVHFDAVGDVLLGQRMFATWSSGEGPPRR